MTDRRKQCKATPPGGKVGRMVAAYLEPADYRKLYEITMQRGESMAETIRQLIRETEK